MEIYEPWYCSQPRPTISSAPASVEWGQSFQVQTPKAASVGRVVLMRAGSSTHAFDNDQRCIVVDFTHSGASTLQVTAPPNRNVAPPGYYMLFVLDCAGVPSVGRFIQIIQGFKFRKELKPELKELKELVAEKTHIQWENKLIKAEIAETGPKSFNEPKGLKENVENPGKFSEVFTQPGPLGDPSVLVRLLAARIDDLERRLATGQAFIRPGERPAVGRGAHGQPTLSPGEKAVLDAATPPPPPRPYDDLTPVERYTRVHDKAMTQMPMPKTPAGRRGMAMPAKAPNRAVAAPKRKSGTKKRKRGKRTSR